MFRERPHLTGSQVSIAFRLSIGISRQCYSIEYNNIGDSRLNRLSAVYRNLTLATVQPRSAATPQRVSIAFRLSIGISREEAS